MRPKKRTVRKGTFDVEVDGRKIDVKGKEVTKTNNDRTVVKFKARGVGEENPIKRISDKLVKKGGLVKKDKKKTVYKKGY